MAAIIPNSLKSDLVRGNINFAADTFKVMLLTSAYTPNRDTHSKRSSLSNEASGTGYTAAGAVVAVVVEALDFTDDEQVVSFGSVSWPSSSITARYAAYYKSRGGSSSADELVFINDFGSDVTSSTGTFTLPSATLTLADP